MNIDEKNNVSVDDLSRLDYYIVQLHRLEAENKKLKEELVTYKKLHGELSESFDEFIALQKLSEVINTTLDEEIIATSLLKLIHEVIPFSEGIVFVNMGDEFKGYPETHHPDFTTLFSDLSDEGFLQWLFEKKGAIILPVDELMFEEAHQWSGKNLLLIPLIAFNEGMGAVIAISDKSQDAFQYKDFELVNMLAFQAAMAYHHTRIFKKLKIAHEELKKSQNELLRTIKLATVGELSGGVAHEINNPLQIILGNIQLARIKKNYDEALKVIEEQSIRISNIVKSLLTFVRQDYKDVFNEYIVPSQVIRKAFDLVRGQLEKIGIKVHLEKLQPTSSIQLNTNYCQQIFLNLFLNSKNNLPEGGDLYVESRELDEYIEIKMWDNGSPMSEEFINRIMQPFEMTGTQTEPLQLSMAVTIQMIKDINGLIQINASNGVGNEIVIHLPKAQRAENEAIDV
jgi:signal transduction histidine kinase